MRCTTEKWNGHTSSSNLCIYILYSANKIKWSVYIFQEWSTNPSCELHFLIFNDYESVELGSNFFFHPIILNRLASYLKMMYHYYQNWQHKSCIVFLKLATFKDLSCLFYQPLCCEIHLYCEIHYVAASINIIIKFLRCYFTIHYTFTEHAIKLCKINYIFTTTTWERMNIGANCTRLWNISFSIFPTKSNSIYHQNYWQICIMKPHGNHWPSKRQSAATPRVSSSFSLFLIKGGLPSSDGLMGKRQNSPWHSGATFGHRLWASLFRLLAQQNQEQFFLL